MRSGGRYRRDSAVRAGSRLNAPKGPSLAADGAQPAPGNRDHERAKRKIYGTMRLPCFCGLSPVIGIGSILLLKVDFAHIPMCRFHLRFVNPALFGCASSMMNGTDTRGGSVDSATQFGVGRGEIGVDVWTSCYSRLGRSPDCEAHFRMMQRLLAQIVCGKH